MFLCAEVALVVLHQTLLSCQTVLPLAGLSIAEGRALVRFAVAEVTVFVVKAEAELRN